jgi:KAP-like P-loop domain-containing protein
VSRALQDPSDEGPAPVKPTRSLPLKILLDSPSVRPVLNFDEYATALKNIIEGSDPRFSIGIFGGWGSGKTTLMKTIEKQLDSQIVSVWFNAWRYEKEEHLIIPLLDALRDELVEWAADDEVSSRVDTSTRDRAVKAASTITKAIRAIFAGTTIKANLGLVEVDLDANKTVAEWRDSTREKDKQDAESPQSSYHASFKALQESLTEFTEKGKQRVVIFIDDLDRCLPPNALQVLESMKLFFDLEGFVFVVGLDQDVIEASVDWHYRRSDISGESKGRPPVSGAEYIKKLFQVPFTIPVVPANQLDQYLKAIFSNEGQYEDQDRLLEIIRPHLNFVIGDSGVNFREVKRYINSYILQKMIDPDLDDDVSLVLQTMAFRVDWRDAYRVFLAERSEFIDAAKRQLDGEENTLRNLDPRLGQLPDSFLEYINSKNGRKLLGLDAPQIERQVRALEVTQQPERPFTRWSAELATAGRRLDAITPSDLDQTRYTVSNFRDIIIRMDEELSASGVLDGYPDLEDSFREAMREIKDQGDTLEFILRRGDDVRPEDFEDFLRRRSRVLANVRTAQELMRQAGEISAKLPFRCSRARPRTGSSPPFPRCRRPRYARAACPAGARSRHSRWRARRGSGSICSLSRRPRR